MPVSRAFLVTHPLFAELLVLVIAAVWRCADYFLFRFDERWGEIITVFTFCSLPIYGCAVRGRKRWEFAPLEPDWRCGAT